MADELESELANDLGDDNPERRTDQSLAIDQDSTPEPKRQRQEEEDDDGDGDGRKGVSLASPDIADEQGGDAACPPHPGYIAGMCIRCGVVEEDDDEDDGGADGSARTDDRGTTPADASVNLKYIGRNLHVSEEPWLLDVS